MPMRGRVEITGYRPGALSRVCEMQTRYYAREWGFGLPFETRVAADMAAFLANFDAGNDLFRVAVRDGEILGSITIIGHDNDADENLAHLRWFIMDDRLRGTGTGGELLRQAVGFARDSGRRGVYLWTFEGLTAARHLYEQAGFRLVESNPGMTWGKQVTEQRFDLIF